MSGAGGFGKLDLSAGFGVKTKQLTPAQKVM
jgi:hypothetical protein